MPRRPYRHILLTVVLLAGAIAALIYLPPSLAHRQHRSVNPRVRIPASHGFPVTLIDALDNEITLKKKPSRIISLSPNVTEILFALTVGKHVIADTTYCDYPAEAAKLPKIGGYLDPNVEKITALSPDLVIGSRGTRRQVFDHLRSLGVPIVAVEPETFAEVADTIRLIGRAVGEEDRAEAQAAALEQRRLAVLTRTKSLPEVKRPRVLFLFSPDGYYSAGPGSHIDTLITEAGGRNIAADVKTTWPQLSLEKIIADDPQVILLLVGKTMATPLTPEQALKQFTKDKRWREVSAVKHRRIILLDEDIVTIPGPRMAEALERMAQGLHPAIFLQGSTAGHGGKSDLEQR